MPFDASHSDLRGALVSLSSGIDLENLHLPPTLARPVYTLSRSKFYDRHLKVEPFPAIFQCCQQRLICDPIGEIESGDTKDAHPGAIAEIFPDPGKCLGEVGSGINDDAGIVAILDDFCEIIDWQPPITVKPDDHHWPETGRALQWIDSVAGFPNDFLIRPTGPNGHFSPGGAIAGGGPRCGNAHELI
jgi:hypothetical protein